MNAFEERLKVHLELFIVQDIVFGKSDWVQKTKDCPLTFNLLVSDELYCAANTVGAK